MSVTRTTSHVIHPRRSSRTRLLALEWLAALLAMPAGCKSDTCDPDLVNYAVSFMKAHQSCSVDADCVVVSDYCATLPGGYCGQLVMSREGRDSPEWSDIDRELKNCGPEECTQCLAALVPGCNEGSCNGP